MHHERSIFRRSQPRAARQRGAVYLAALGASMLIAVIGISAALATRVQTRIADLSNRTQHAQHAAESAIDFAQLQIANDVNWRTTYTNNTWVANVTFAKGTMTFKLVDEADASLSNDATQPVRLHGKGVVGSSTRLLSVELAPDATGRMRPVAGTWKQEILP